MTATVSSPVRWGILSTARINEDVIPAFRASKTSVLTAVASRDATRAKQYAELHGIPTSYGAYEYLLSAPDIDAVYISLPNGLHREWVSAALLAGKHVLCEKPLTPTAAEAEDLFDTASHQGLLLAEAFMYRHHPQTLKLRDLVQGGSIGGLQTIRARFRFTVPDPSTDIRYQPDLAGGALRDVGCYCVSLAGLLAESEPEDVVGLADFAATGVDERFYGMLRYPGGAVCQFDCSLVSPPTQSVTVSGSQGEIFVPTPWYPHLPPMGFELRLGATTSEVSTPGPNSYLLEIDDFASALLDGRNPRVTRDETLQVLRTMDRLFAVADPLSGSHTAEIA